MKKILLLLFCTASVGGVHANNSLQHIDKNILTAIVNNIWKDQKDSEAKQSAGLPTTKPQLDQLIALKKMIPNIDPDTINTDILMSLIKDHLVINYYLSGDRIERNTPYDMVIIFIAVMRTYTTEEDKLLSYNTILGNTTIANQFLANEDKFIDAFLYYIRHA